MKYLILVILILIAKNLLFKESFNENDLVSPDITSIEKKGDKVIITFQESIRKQAEFIKNPAPAEEKAETDYDVLYINKSLLDKDSFDKNGNLIKYNLQNWNSIKVFSKDTQIKLHIKDLKHNEYYFTVLMVKNNERSKRIKFIKVSEKEPYNLFKFSDSNNNEIGVENLGIKVYTPCKYYRDKKTCPDNLHGEILSRCYWDKSLDECRQSYEEEYLSD